MSAFYATLNGALCASVRLRVGRSGAWFATVTMPTAFEVPSACSLVIGDQTLRGTCAADDSGSFAGTGTLLVVGGANAWGKPVAARHYHNEGGVRRNQVAADLAREVGETLVTSSALDGLLGTDFVREAAPASRVLEQLYPSAEWWVGFDGVTRVGERATVDVSKRVQILEFDPTQQAAELALLDLGPGSIADLMPGSAITDAVRKGSAPFVVRDVTICVEASRIRATAWSFDTPRERVAHLIQTLAQEGDPKRVYARGPFRFRVFSMDGDRVRLQAVARAPGLPDVLPVAIAPGMAGMKAQLTPGAVVLVDFVEGDPSMPIVTHFSRPDDPGFLPASVDIDATTVVNLGGGYSRAIRVGDKLQISGLVAPSGGGPVTCPSGATIVIDPSVLTVGAPPTGKSKVFL